MRKFPNINLIKKKTLLESLKELGKIIHIKAEMPFFLSDPTKIYLVHFGLVGIFYVKRDSEGKILSPRKYLQHIERDQLIPYLGQVNDDGTRVDLMAISTHSKLIEINQSEFFSFLSEPKEMLDLLNPWMDGIINSLFTVQAPRVFSKIQKEGNQLLEAGSIVYRHDHLVWVKIVKGMVRSGGKGHLTSSEDALVPVTDWLWLEAMEHTEIRCFTPVDLISKNLFQDAFCSFVALISTTLAHEIESQSLQNQKHLTDQRQSDTHELENSIVQFGATLDSQTTSFLASNSPDVLIAACQEVGSQIQVKIVSPDNLDTMDFPLEAIAHQSGLRIREVMLRAEWWQQENGHLLAFTQKDQRPVALIQKDGYYLAKDPDTEKRVKVTKEFAQSLEPKAQMFIRPFDKPIRSVFDLWKFTMHGLHHDVKLIILVAFVGSILGLFTPVLIGILMDDVIPQADTDYLVETISIMVVIGILSALLGLIQNVFLIRIESKGTLNSQSALMDHLLRLPTGFFKKYTAGDLANRALSINKIRQILSNSVLQIVLSGAFSFVNLALLFYYQVPLAFIALAFAFAAMLFVIFMGHRKLAYNRKIETIRGKLSGVLFEFLSAISKVRIAGAELRIFSIWANQFSQQKTAAFKSGTQQNKVTVFVRSFPLFTNMVFFFFIYYKFQQAGGQLAEETGVSDTIANALAIQGQISAGITVGVFLAFISAFKQFLQTSLKMGEMMIEALEIVPLYERLQPLLEERPDSENKAMAKPLRGGIEINHLKFKYEKEGNVIIDDLTLTIKPNEMVAFVGASGSGKSTLIRLLLGFEKPQSGSIYYDGQDLSSLDLSSIRNQIGVVLQNGALTPTSLFNNIVGSRNLTIEDAWEAARMSGLDQDIEQMPMKMNTLLSEGAKTLSGGQSQRLMIARAIAHHPRLLFFDEATSALDNHTQKVVTESLTQLKATRIVIAHRLSTIQHADRILVLDKGKIVEEGNYQSLMDQYGLFYELAMRQQV